MDDDNDGDLVGPLAGRGHSGNLPPRASFFGVRSLSLDLLGLGVFSLLLLFIFNLLDFLFGPITYASPLSGSVPGTSQLRGSSTRAAAHTLAGH